MRSIIYVHEDGGGSAKQLYDCDVIGLPITIAYTLQAVWHQVKPGTFDVPYQAIPIKDDPWFKWVLESQNNYIELWNYGMDLIEEHYHRFGSKAVVVYRHGSHRSVERMQYVPPLPEGSITSMPQPELDEVIKQYRSRTGFWVSYTNRERPEWLK